MATFGYKTTSPMAQSLLLNCRSFKKRPA